MKKDDGILIHHQQMTTMLSQSGEFFLESVILNLNYEPQNNFQIRCYIFVPWYRAKVD